MIKLERPQQVGSANSQNREAIVRRRLTAERQVTSALLPDFTHQATGSNGRIAVNEPPHRGTHPHLIPAVEPKEETKDGNGSFHPVQSSH